MTNTRAMDYRIDWRAAWERTKADACAHAWRIYMRDQSRRLFLYFTPSDGAVPGQFYVGHDDESGLPAGAELVTAESIPMAEQRTIARWLERFAGRLPMLPTA